MQMANLEKLLIANWFFVIIAGIMFVVVYWFLSCVMNVRDLAYFGLFMIVAWVFHAMLALMATVVLIRRKRRSNPR